MRAFGWRVGAGAAWPEAWHGVSRMDGAGDGPGAIPDVPRLEGAAAGVGHWTILAEARARRECALAYRATVDAVYAEAELDAGARRPATAKSRTTPQLSGRILQRTAPGLQRRGLPERGAWTRTTGQSRGYGKHAVNLIEHTI